MKENRNKISIARILIIITLIAVAIATFFLPVQKADAAEMKYNYNFVYYYYYNGEMRKVEATYSSDRQCILFKSHGGAGTRGTRMTASSQNDKLRMYRLNDSGTYYEEVFPIVTSYSIFKDGEYVSDTSYVSGSKTMLDFAPGFILSQGYLDLCNSNIKILACNSGNRNSDTIIYQYLSTGKISSEYKDDVFVLSGTSLFTKYFTSGKYAYATDDNLQILNAEIDDNGLITYTPPIIPDDALESGISIIIPTKNTYSYIFDYPLRLGSAIQTHFNNQGLPNVSPIASIILQPYYVGSNGYVHIGKPCEIGIAWQSNYYTKEDNNNRLFTITTKSLEPELVDPNGDEEFSHGGGGSRRGDYTDNSISKNGTYDADIPTPVLKFDSDGSKFYINNADDDYKIEVQGRWYSVDDIEIYRDGALWKFRYGQIIKNGLSTWVPLSDNVLSRGEHNIFVYGESSFESFLKDYPVNERNIYGSTNVISDYFNGYNDAKNMLLSFHLPTSASVFNGPEIYIRFYSVGENGSIYYGKWCHWYSSLAKSSGSSGSLWDDEESIKKESQSKNGLTDDDKSALEKTGDSKKNDNDVNTTLNTNSGGFRYSDTGSSDALWNTVDSLSTRLGDFPALFASIFSFLPDWVPALIGLAIGALVILRFLGR